MVGANGLSVALARLFLDRQWTVVMIDGVRSKLAALQKEGVVGVPGDARDAVTYENAGVERDAQFLAVTTNDELNLLVAELVRDEFGVEHPVVLMQQRSEEFGSLRRAWVDLLSGQDLNLPAWGRRLEDGTAQLLTLDLPRDESIRQLYRSLIEEKPPRVVPVVAWHDNKPYFDAGDEEFKSATRVTVMLTTDAVPDIEELSAGKAEAESLIAEPAVDAQLDSQVVAASDLTGDAATGDESSDDESGEPSRPDKL